MQHLGHLKTIISPSVAVVVWASKNPLHQELELFHEMNYFFDDLLIKKLAESSCEAKEQFFFTQSFGEKLTLLHLVSDKNLKAEDLKKTLSNLKTSLQGERNKVVIIDQEKIGLYPICQKLLSDCELIEF